MGLFGARKALASDCRELQHERSMAPAAQGILVPKRAEQKHAMRLSGLLVIEQVWVLMVTCWFAVQR